MRKSVGLLFNNDARTVCSAFCVADNVIATAAHCLARGEGKARVSLSTFRFALKGLPGEPSSRLAGAPRGAVRNHLVSGLGSTAGGAPVDASRDWALVRLAQPICEGSALQVSSRTPRAISALAGSQRLFQVSFHRDVADWSLSYSNPCPPPGEKAKISKRDLAREFGAHDDLVLHQCDTGGASSGSPLLMLIQGKPRFVGVNVGTYVQTRLMMRAGKVVHRFRADPIANTAVAAQAFADHVGVLSAAQVLVTRAEVRALQTGLLRAGYNVGVADGSFGPLTGAAILAFERDAGLAPLGIPRRRVLEALRGAAPRLSNDEVTRGAERTTAPTGATLEAPINLGR
ncbi:MAG: peptidoglycan-binding protein [Pseudomonadota bacterium]